MTKSPIEYIDSTLIGPAMLFLNQYFNSVLPEYYVLCVCLVINLNVYRSNNIYYIYDIKLYVNLQAWSIIDLSIYSIFVCKEICDHLRVYLFYIIPTISSSKLSTSCKISGTTNKNGSNNLSGSYQHHFKYPSTMTSFIYPTKTKTKY